MGRRSGFISTLAQIDRELKKNEKARQKAQMNAFKQAQKDAQQLQKEYESAQKEYQRAQVAQTKEMQRAQAAQAKEQARLYSEMRAANVTLQNEEVEQRILDLSEILKATLGQDDYLDLDFLKTKPDIPVFNPAASGIPTQEPRVASYWPEPLTTMQKLVPSIKKKHEQATEEAKKKYEDDVTKHRQRLADYRARHERQVAEIRRKADAKNAEIEEFKQGFRTGNPEAVVDYFTLVLEASSYPEGFPQHAKLAYVPESKQLVVEYDLPTFDVVPVVGTYKYIKTKDEVTETVRPSTQRKALYASVTAQVALRTLHELFEADRTHHVDTIVFNGYVDSIDKATGRPVRPCLITVRTTGDIFTGIDLSKVDPIVCLKHLNASVSKSPDELAPVRPVLEFSMVDPRFVEETDVLSTLDQRPNLMELTPLEFESLITNLFEKMGLETRLTQASRDGGVDCVAYDPRPIFGGKVVIQAKRYKHTVGVSAVRDLFGTMQNEGASKGILVTTSGYGKAAYEFAGGKPLELLDGGNLLHLLAEHAGIEAKIQVPETWKDPIPDSAPLEKK